MQEHRSANFGWKTVLCLLTSVNMNIWVEDITVKKHQSTECGWKTVLGLATSVNIKIRVENSTV